MGFGRKRSGLGIRNQFLPMWRCMACGKRFDAQAKKGFFKRVKCPFCKSKKTKRVY